MRPNLAYATLDGGVDEVVELDPTLHRNSIRHLAAADGAVAFAMQWQGDPMEPVPLLGLHRRGGAAILCTADVAEQRAMLGYAGSIAITRAHVAITSPRGGRLHVYRRDGSFAASVIRPDVCGLAAGLGGLVATDGLGGVIALSDGTIVPLRSAPNRAWDNHLILCGA